MTQRQSRTPDRGLEIIMKKYIYSILISFFIGSCGGGGSISVLPTEDEFAQFDTINPKMDILWVVDNSVSMRDEISNVVANINAFISVYQEKKYDFRMAVIPTSAWALEAYNEYAIWKECTLLEPDPSACDSIKPEDNSGDGGDRSYLRHPADGKDLFSRLHTGECTNTNSGYKVIDKNTPDLAGVFEKNFNVFGRLTVTGDETEASHCGFNANLNPSHSSHERYVEFVHNYYYGTTTTNGSGEVLHYGSAQRNDASQFVVDERPLQSMRAFLTAGLSEDLSLFLREDAFLAVILITDEKDGSSDATLKPSANNATPFSDPQVWVDFLEGVKGTTELFNIYAIGYGNNEAESGQLYSAAKLGKAAKLSGGLSLPITGAEAEYLDVLTEITGNIVRASTNFKLNCVPIESSITVVFYEPIGGDEYERIEIPKDEGSGGWTYHASGQLLTFSEEYFPQNGTRTFINYTPQNLNCNTQNGNIE